MDLQCVRHHSEMLSKTVIEKLNVTFNPEVLFSWNCIRGVLPVARDGRLERK